MNAILGQASQNWHRYHETYSYTDYTPPYALVICGCGRKYSPGEFYYCGSCKQHRCKYCVKIDIEALYCKSCLEVMPPVEALSYNNHCTRCYECPSCYSIMNIMISHSKDESKYYFSCQFCFWNSFKVGMVGLKPETLLSREKIDPLQLIYDRKLQMLKEKQEEEDKALEAQDFVMRRTIGRREVKEKYTLEKLNADLEAKEKKRKLLPPKVETFSALYGVEDLDKAGASDFLDQFDNSVSTSTNLDQILAERVNLKEISSIDQRHRNPKCQSNRIEYFYPIIPKISLLLPSSYDKMALKSKRCMQCNNPVLQTAADLARPSPFTFSNFLIQYIPKVYFLACRIYDGTMGDAFVEVINTNMTEMSVILSPYSATTIDSDTTAELLPLEETIEVGMKESTRDELLIIDDVGLFQKLPKASKSTLIKCKKNAAIVQLAFSIKEGAGDILFGMMMKVMINRGSEKETYEAPFLMRVK